MASVAIKTSINLLSMRSSMLITCSVPPTMVAEAKKVAKKQRMSSSELLRAALQHFLEEFRLEEAVRIADEELRDGKARVLPKGGLAAMIGG